MVRSRQRAFIMGPKQQFDAFLPSGAVVDFNLSPRSLLPNHIPQPLHGGGSHASPPNPKPHPAAQSLSYFSPSNSHSEGTSSRRLSHSQNRDPISPPVSRSASSNGNNTAFDNWRSHIEKFRQQAEGEKAHMISDRARADELVAEERAMRDEERDILLARIVQLETQLAAFTGQPTPQSNQNSIFRSNDEPPQATTPQQIPPCISPRGNTNGGISGTDGTPAANVRQESGRLPDGNLLWAPASRNPSRTFQPTESNNLRVDSMSTPRGTPIRVTSKELTASDFVVNSPPNGSDSRADSAVVENSIDVSHIQPSLDGIPLKASAVSTEFKANIMSPKNAMSPSKNSSAVVSPPHLRDTTNGGSPSKKTSTLEVITAPEDDRRTMHAGHTPSHSITKFGLDDSGNVTPRQPQLHSRNISLTEDHVDMFDGSHDEDPELTGPLTLRNDPDHDVKFLKVVNQKLFEAEANRVSPSSSSSSSEVPMAAVNSLSQGASSAAQRRDTLMSEAESDDSSEKEVPRLRVKPSTNFGRPFGSL